MQFLMSRLQPSAISCSCYSAWINSRGLPTETAACEAVRMLNLVELTFDRLTQFKLVDVAENETVFAGPS
jgi:hypothetical protein